MPMGLEPISDQPFCSIPRIVTPTPSGRAAIPLRGSRKMAAVERFLRVAEPGNISRSLTLTRGGRILVAVVD